MESASDAVFPTLNVYERKAFDVFSTWKSNHKLFSFFVGWAPVLFVVTILVLGNFGFNYVLCYQRIYSNHYETLAKFGILTFNTLWIIGMTCLYKAVTSEPGAVPQSFIDTMKNESKYQNNSNNNGGRSKMVNNVDEIQIKCIPVSEGTVTNEQLTSHTLEQMEAIKNGFIICRRCENPRPPRSHHCRHCKVCIRKMDHHCPLINNCVGFNNYKFFILTVFYAFVGCLEGVIFVFLDYYFDISPWQVITSFF